MSENSFSFLIYKKSILRFKDYTYYLNNEFDDLKKIIISIKKKLKNHSENEITKKQILESIDLQGILINKIIYPNDKLNNLDLFYESPSTKLKINQIQRILGFQIFRI